MKTDRFGRPLDKATRKAHARSNRRHKLNAWMASHPKGPLSLDEYPFWPADIKAEQVALFERIDAEYEADKAAIEADAE
jgi:hypothetical protein